MKQMKVRITFTEPVLGSSPGDKEIYSNFIGSKGPNAMTLEEEVEAIGEDAVEEKGTTVFPRLEDGTPFLWDYQVRGFFKSACKFMNLSDAKNKLTAYKSKIDGLVFVEERKIPFEMPKKGEIGILQRPLRASTAQGERVALASSETIPEGTSCEFTITCLDDSLMKRVETWLDYGKYSGLGQWRNGSYGRFTWEEVKA